MNDWKEYKVGEIANIENGFAFKSKDFSDKGVPILKIKNVKPNKINTNDLSFVPNEIASKLSKYIIKKGDILITMSGNRIDGSPDSWVGKVATFNLNEAFLLNQRVSKLVVNSEKINPKYLSYVLGSYEYQYYFINKANSSGGQANISPEIVRNTFFKAPNIFTQSIIAEILSSLDDKIELNNKINQELESLAQLLFKRWFVDFEFPNENGEPYKSSGGEMVDSELGEIPKGWEVKKLKQILNIKRGGSPRPIHDYMASSGLPWVKISDATALNSPYLFSTKEFIKVEGLKKTILIKKGSLILSNSATPGLPIFLELDACIHDGWLHFQDIQDVSYNFLYLLFLYIRKDLVGQGNGSIFINLKTDILKEYSISIPNKKVFEKFSDTVDSIFSLIKNNSSENIELQKLRDTLLPKLISGELQINDN